MLPQLLPCCLYSSGRLLSLPNPLLQQRWAESCRLQYPPGLSGVGFWPSLVIFPPLWSISQARLALCRLHSQILAEQGSARAVCGVFPAGNMPALYSAKDLGLQPLEWVFCHFLRGRVLARAGCAALGAGMFHGNPGRIVPKLQVCDQRSSSEHSISKMYLWHNLSETLLLQPHGIPITSHPEAPPAL